VIEAVVDQAAAVPGEGEGQDLLRALQAAMGHPVQAQILAELADEGRQSAAGLASRIGVPVRSVRHQLSRLAAQGLIEVSASHSRRGALEKLYDICATPTLGVVEHERMRPEEARRITTEVFRRVAVDVTRALGAGSFGRDDSCEIRLGTELDEQGWDEIAKTMRRAYEEVEEAKERASRRLRQGEARLGISVLFWFERPSPVDPGWKPSGHLPPAGRRTAELPDGDDTPREAPPATLVAAMGHPARAKILSALSSTHPLGVAQIAELIREPRRRVRYHLDRLVADGLVERLRSEGRTRWRYVVAVVPVLGQGDFDGLTPAESLRIGTEIFRSIAIDTAIAISTGVFYERPDFCETRVPIVADAEGWEEVLAISVAAYRRVDVARAEAAERLASSGAKPITATAAILWFELPRS
jgi:DNA-binding transcriptional ArsR family regulator